MDQTEPSGAVDQTAAPQQTEGSKPMGHLLREAALHELKASERERYAAENAQDRAEQERLRHELNASNDARRAQEWDMAVERELDSAQRRADWLEAHNRTIDAKHACQQAQRAWKAEYRPYEHEQRAELRHEREDAEDDWRALRREADLRLVNAYAARHAAWVDACAATAEAKGRMKAAAKEQRAVRKAARPEERAAQEHARAERNALEDARDAAIRRATQERAVATALRRDLERDGTAEQIRQACDREAELRAAEVELVEETRHLRCREEDERVAARTKKAGDDALAYASLRAEWLEAKHEQALARRAMRAADRAARPQERAERAELTVRIRAERQQRAEERRLASNALNTNRELRLAELQEAYLDALAAEHAEWDRAMEIDKPARAEALAAERELQAHHREERNAEADAYQKAVWDMAKERGYARAMEREAARETADDVYAKLRGEMAAAKEDGADRQA